MSMMTFQAPPQGNNYYQAQNKYQCGNTGWYKGPAQYERQSKLMCGPGGCAGGRGGGGCCKGGMGGGGMGGGGMGGMNMGGMRGMNMGGNGGCGSSNKGGCAMVSKESTPKQYISRKAFNGIRMNLKRTRILGFFLTIFGTLTVGLGIASILLYQYGKTNPMTWCSNPFPNGNLNLSLNPIKPAFDYIVVTAGLWGLFPMLTGILTSYLTRIYGTYAKTAMYLSFFAIVSMPPMFALSLVGFFMGFGPGGSAPSCVALSVVNFLVVVHAVVCSAFLYAIYATMSRFLKNLKKDPSVDYLTLKKYYGVSKITVLDDEDDDEVEDEEKSGCCAGGMWCASDLDGSGGCSGGGCCGGGCCDMDYDSDSTEGEEEDVETMTPQKRGAPNSATNYCAPVAMYTPSNHHHHQAYMGNFGSNHHHHNHHLAQTHYAQPHHPHAHQCTSHYKQPAAMPSYPFSNHKHIHGHAHMATRYNPKAF